MRRGWGTMVTPHTHASGHHPALAGFPEPGARFWLAAGRLQSRRLSRVASTPDYTTLHSSAPYFRLESKYCAPISDPLQEMGIPAPKA
jgi:hypothetical protein